MQSTATTGNVNGAGFNIANAGMIADLACANATSATPTVTSATYTFLAGDVGQYLYVKLGTHWQAGWYLITGVVAGAQLDAAIGNVVTSIGQQGVVVRNTTAGCTSDATSSINTGTFAIDYSQTDTAVINAIADFNAVGASTTMTSATAGFTPVMVGNIFHQTTTGTGAFGVVGWYEIATYVNATTVTLDRAPNSGTASVNTTGYVGGAGVFNGLEDTFKTTIPASSIVWIKNGTYTVSAAATTASTNSTAALPSFFIGYTSIRGDACNQSNRPTLALGANQWSACQDVIHRNIIVTGTAALMLVGGVNGHAINCKFYNSSSTINRVAYGPPGNSESIGCEVICQNGTGCSAAAAHNWYGSYVHDCTTGILSSVSGASYNRIVGNLFESNTTSDFSCNNVTGQAYVTNNTFYGREAKMGIAVNLSGANTPTNKVFNNIIYGKTTGVSVSTGFAYTNIGYNNTFFNNTTDVINWTKDLTDIAVNPQFVNASQLTGTTANTSGSVLTDGSANFSGVNDGVDFLHVVSGTGVTTGGYLIVSHTSTTLTVNNPLGTSSSNNDVYWVTNGHNFQVNSAFVGNGSPSFTNASGGQNTSYPTIGAMIPQASAGGSGGTPILNSAIIQSLGAI